MTSMNVLETAKRIRRQLVSSARYEQLLLAASIGTSDTTLQFAGALPNGLTVGSVLGADLELMYVTAVDRTAVQATVIRGYEDTDPAAHASGILVDVNARFRLFDIVEAMRAEIDSWSQELYWLDADTLSVSTSALTYELPAAWATCYGIVDVRQSDGSDTEAAATTWPRMGAKLIRGVGATFDGAPTSGLLLRFTEGIRRGAIYVLVAMPYTTAGSLSPTADLVTDLHLTTGLVEVVEIGAKKRLIVDGNYEELARQPLEPQRFGEATMVSTITSMVQLFEAQYIRRKQAEVNRLRRYWPLRMQ